MYTGVFFNDLMLGEFGRASGSGAGGPADVSEALWRFRECRLVSLLRHDVESPPDPDRAWALVKELDRLDPPERGRDFDGREYHTIYRRVVAATISARAGRPDIARAEIARARRATAADTVLNMDLNYDEAYLRLVLGERARAVELLRSYVDRLAPWRATTWRNPLLRDLRVTP